MVRDCRPVSHADPITRVSAGIKLRGPSTSGKHPGSFPISIGDFSGCSPIVGGGQSARSEGRGAASGRTGEFFRFRDSLPRRSREHRILGGVCGGLAEAWNMPVTAVRVGVILASFLPGPMFLVYVGAWCLMLDEPAPAQY